MGEYGGVGGGGKNQTAGWGGPLQPFTPKIREKNENEKRALANRRSLQVAARRKREKAAKKARRRGRA